MYCPMTSDNNLDFLDILTMLSTGLQFQQYIDYGNNPTTMDLWKRMDRIESKLDKLLKQFETNPKDTDKH